MIPAATARGRARLLALGLWLLASAALAPAAGAVPAERRVALVVGNGAYAGTVALRNPPNDARAVAGALRGPGFEVVEAIDVDHPAMLETLAGFAERLEGAQVGLFFYAGHGLQVAGENYLVPVDAKLKHRFQNGPRRFATTKMQAGFRSARIVRPSLS